MSKRADFRTAAWMVLTLCSFDLVGSLIAFKGGRAMALPFLSAIVLPNLMLVLFAVMLVLALIKKLPWSSFAVVLAGVGLFFFAPDFGMLYLRGVKTRVTNDAFLEKLRNWVLSQEKPEGDQLTTPHGDPERTYAQLPDHLAAYLGRNMAYLSFTGSHARELKIGGVGFAFGSPPVSAGNPILKVEDGSYLYLDRRL